jgi:hypothetical protein
MGLVEAGLRGGEAVRRSRERRRSHRWQRGPWTSGLLRETPVKTSWKQRRFV